MNNRTSPVWLLETIELQALLDRSSSYREVLANLGIRSIGGNNGTLHRRIAKEGLDLTQLRLNRKLLLSKLNRRRSIPLEEMLVSNSHCKSQAVKKRIIAAGLVLPLCAKCGLSEVWNGERLVLQLDHINGKREDNRLENLRLLCPNCHSQTPTFAGRSLKRKLEEKVKVKRIQFSKCPDKESLARLVWEIPAVAVANRFGVSDRTVGKWCRKLGIAKPSRGYWSKQKSIGDSYNG